MCFLTRKADRMVIESRIRMVLLKRTPSNMTAKLIGEIATEITDALEGRSDENNRGDQSGQAAWNAAFGR
jgi:hypothetical protein